MKDIENIEELLNCFIDNELDERKSNEVKRLIDNDAKVREMYESLSRYKKLICSLRPAGVPEGFAQSVTLNLEREMLLADTGIYYQKKGKRRFVMRQFITAAAMIVLLAMLSFVIFDVFVPKSSRQRFANNYLHRKSQVVIENPTAKLEPVEDKIVELPKGPAVPLVVRLTLITESPIETDWLIGKALTSTSLFDKTSAVDRKSASVKYSLSCDRKALLGLMEELTFVWPKCEKAIMEVGTEQSGKFVTVNNITAGQMLEICKASTFTQRMRIAGDVSVINEAADTDVLRNYFARQNADSELIIADKPALTSTEKIAEPQNEISTDPANLTIMVIGK
ncbi:MAG: hypothetical protein ABFD79_15240 [Phycisphaerales bacterium]